MASYEEIADYASFSEIWRLIKIARPEARNLSIAVVLLLVSSALFVVLPLVVGKVMNLATSKPIEETEIFGLSLYQFFGAFALALTVGACANFGSCHPASHIHSEL